MSTRRLAVEHSLERGIQIRLKGRWLARLGFEPGQRVTVECQPGRLLILHEAPTPAEGFAAYTAQVRARLDAVLPQPTHQPLKI